MRYRTIVADPPWAARFRSRVRGGPQRSHGVPYPTMSVAEISALPVRDLAEADAHLYLWTINAYVRDAYEVARAWGFTPSTLLIWCKSGNGGGGAFGTAAEFVLFCRRGSLAAKSKQHRNWFTWAQPYATGASHGPLASAKPEAFLDLVEQVSPGPFLEMFSRRARLGWDTWGDEALGGLRALLAKGQGA